MKLLAVLAAAIAVILVATFGTLSPCGILRENERKQDGLAAILPDAIVDAALAAKYGSLTPRNCVGLLLSGRSGPEPAQVAAAPQQQIQTTAAPPSMNNANDFEVALQRADAAMGECRNKRLRGELKTHLESVQCSNPRVSKIFSAAKYRYMDLIEMMNSKRLEIAMKLDIRQITKEQASTESKALLAQLVKMERSRDLREN
jgi:hypothetical protein